MSGSPPSRAARPGGIRIRLRALRSAPLASGAVSVASARFAGRLFLIVETADGHRRRLDPSGQSAPLTDADVARAAANLADGSRVNSVKLVARGDAYYFNAPKESVSLPAYRVIVGDAERTRFYLDPVSGQIEARVDRNAKAYRWLHEGLHRLDFVPPATWPARESLTVVLLAGVLGLCVTGVALGLRRTMHPRDSSAIPARQKSQSRDHSRQPQ